MKPSRAGRRVSDAVIVSATPIAAASPIPDKKFTPRVNIPSTAMHTIIPANATARPDVSTDLTIDGSMSRPASTPWRCRVTMNKA